MRPRLRKSFGNPILYSVTEKRSEPSYHLATWLGKEETEDGTHYIQSVRKLMPAEYESARGALGELMQFDAQEAFTYVTENAVEYSDYEEAVWDSLASEPISNLQQLAPEYGGGLRNRFLNWLLSVKAFLDLTEAQLNRRYGKGSEELMHFKQATAVEYDSHFSYRFIYRLRNFAQHSAFPPLEGAIHGAVEETADGEASVRWIELYLSRDKLLSQWDGWGPQGDEVRALPPEIPVDEHMNAAMESLTRIAAAVRQVDLPGLKTAAAVVNALWEEASKQRGAPMIGRFDPDNPTETLSWLWLVRTSFGGMRTEE